MGKLNITQKVAVLTTRRKVLLRLRHDHQVAWRHSKTILWEHIITEFRGAVACAKQISHVSIGRWHKIVFTPL